MKILLLAICVSAVYLTNERTFPTQNVKIALIDTIPKDIPTYKDGALTLSYLFSKKFEEILGLEKLDEGVDSIEIRIWYDFSFVDTSQLIILKYHRQEWKAKFYTFNYKHESSIPSIKLLQKLVEEKEPKSGWHQLITKLNNSNIKTLPDQSKVSGYNLHTDGNGVSIEFATPYNYRIYAYQMLGMDREKFKEVTDTESIVDLIAEEFDFFPLKPLTPKQISAKSGKKFQKKRIIR